MEHANSMISLEEILCNQANESKNPISGSLELLPLCNMNCDMCYVKLSYEEMKCKGRLRTVEEWVSLVKEMQKLGVLFLLLTGGEPLLYPDFRKLYLTLREMGMIITINTNGTLIDSDWADFFSQNPPRRINITLYGSSDIEYDELCHYAEGYEKTIQAIHLLRERGLDVKINGSLVNVNKTSVEKITAISKKFGTAVNIDTYMFPITREKTTPFNQLVRLRPEEAAEMRVMFLKEKKPLNEFLENANATIYNVTQLEENPEENNRMKCRAGKSFFSVNWLGEMRPCVMLSSPMVQVFDIGFEQGWKEIVARVDAIRLSDACSKCSLRQVCRTCAACAMAETGRYDLVPEYMCKYTKSTIKCFEQEVKEYPQI